MKAGKRDKKYWCCMIVGISLIEDWEIDSGHVKVGIVGIEKEAIVDAWVE